MPLDAQNKSARKSPGRIIGRFYRFNDAVGRPGRGAQTAADSLGIYGLMMKGIRLQRLMERNMGDLRDKTARGLMDGVAEAALLIVCPFIAAMGQRLFIASGSPLCADILNQGTSHGNTDQLMTAANPQNGQ